MNRILASARTEFIIALRNRWITIAVAMMVLFSLVLSAAGSAPTGALGADKLSVTVASLTSLAVYLVPLVALLMSFDAIAGEIERGTLSLVLTYPVSRGALILGKFIAHLAILAIAVTAGYGVAAIAAMANRHQCNAGNACFAAPVLDIHPFGGDLPWHRVRYFGLCKAARCGGRSGDRFVAGAYRALRSWPSGSDRCR